MASHPRRVDHFREWSKLMMEQAIVPDRPQYKSTRGPAKSRTQTGSSTRKRRRGLKGRRRAKKTQD